MKINFLTYFFALAIFNSQFYSCKRYEEGPVTFRSAEARITGKDWICNKVLMNNKPQELSEDEDQRSVTNFNKDGSYYIIEPEITILGKWELIEKKEKLKLTYKELDGSENINTLSILKLTNDELWLKGYDENVGILTEIHFSKK